MVLQAPQPQPGQVNGTQVGPLSVNPVLGMPVLLASSSPTQNYYQQQLIKHQHNLNMGIQQQQHQPFQDNSQQDLQQFNGSSNNNAGLFQVQQTNSSQQAATLYGHSTNNKPNSMAPLPAAPFYPSPQQQQQQQQPLYQARQAAIYQQQQQLQNGGSLTLRKLQHQHLQQQKVSPISNSIQTLTRASLPAENIMQEQRNSQQNFLTGATAYQTPNCQTSSLVMENSHQMGTMQQQQQQQQPVYHLQQQTINNSNNNTSIHNSHQADISVIGANNNNSNNNVWSSHNNQDQQSMLVANHQMIQRPVSDIMNNNTLQLQHLQQSNQIMQHHQQQQHQSRPISFITQRHDHQQHQQHPQMMPSSIRATRSSRAFSDRDSVSTLSRFDQTTIDDRRSFTMRSQCTNVNNAKRYTDLGFLRLTGEALKRLMGLANPTSHDQRLLAHSPNDHLTTTMHNKANNQNLHRNLTMTINSNGNGNLVGKQNNNSSSAAASSSNFRPITVIDSGEDYYFKKRVFKYQLSILRLISFILASIVLLSPVVMLLIPKMEFIFNQSSSSGSSINEFDSQALNNDPSSSSVPSIKHAVGLNSLKKQNGNQQHNLQQQQQQLHNFALQPQWRISDCTTDCDGPLIGFVCRFLILCISYWAIFFRPQTSSLPRIDFHRCLIVSFAILIASAYWLFFIFRVFDKRFNDFELQYMTIVHFSTSMLESLILLHYLALILLEIRKRKKIYCLKVVRSPDGASQYYSCGALSIQQCAQYVLEKYSRNFPQYGPYSKQLLELEDELASSSSSCHKSGERHRSPLSRSRASSPMAQRVDRERGRDRDLEDDQDEDFERNTRRSQSRSSRHHSRANSSHHHRSPNRSPLPPSPRPSSSRSLRSQRKLVGSSNTNRGNNDNMGKSNLNTSQSVDEAEQNQHRKTIKEQKDDNNAKIINSRLGSSELGQEKDKEKQQHHLNENKQENNVGLGDADDDNNKNNPNSQQHGSGSNSGDQSSDATTRNNNLNHSPKESSLETIRAVNSSSDLLVSTSQTNVGRSSNKQQASNGGHDINPDSSRTGQSNPSNPNQKLAFNNNNNHNPARLGGNKILERDDETESVRSVRSRRSTSRAHHHRHHGHHGSSSVIASHQHGSSSRNHHHQSRSSNHLDHLDHHDYRDQHYDDNQRLNPLEDHERKLRRRKLRLLMSVQETFDQIKRIEGVEANNPSGQHQSGSRLNLRDSDPEQQQEFASRRPMSANQTSRLVYPNIARTLQKYLRLTKQTGRHNLQSIYEHLSKCLLYNLSARTFLEKFTNQDPVLQQNESNLFVNCRLFDPNANVQARQVDTFEINSWSLVCDTLVSRQIDSGTFFLVRQGPVSLLVSVGKISHLHLQEEVLDQKSCKFLLNPKDESSC